MGWGQPPGRQPTVAPPPFFRSDLYLIYHSSLMTQPLSVFIGLAVCSLFIPTHPLILLSLSLWLRLECQALGRVLFWQAFPLYLKPNKLPCLLLVFVCLSPLSISVMLFSHMGCVYVCGWFFSPLLIDFFLWHTLYLELASCAFILLLT